MKTLMIILLLSVLGMTKANAQTPYRQYADNGILLNFHEIDNVDFRVFLLYNLTRDDQFILTENEESGQFSINPNKEEDNLAFYDAFEMFYQNIYTDFQLLSKMDITEQLPQWKSLVAPQHFTFIMMDTTLHRTRNSNETSINVGPSCTSDFYGFETNNSFQTAQEADIDYGCIIFSYNSSRNSQTTQEADIDYGCIVHSYNPSWHHFRIAVSGQIIIHMEGHDPVDSSIQRDIDFCLWGPYTEEQVSSGYASTHLTSDKIIDCSYSAAGVEDAYLGYPVSEHDSHNNSDFADENNGSTINYHVPQESEYYILMITNFSQQPCHYDIDVDCNILVDNDGPYCVGETIHLQANSLASASYNWTGPNNYRSRYQNPNRSNCTMAMAGPYICTITQNGQSISDTTWVNVYPTPIANFVAPTVSLGNATQFTSTSTTTPPGYTDSIPSYKWDFGDGYTSSGAMASHYYGQAGSYQVTLTVTTGGHCTDEITQTVMVDQNPTGIIPFADANVKALCVAHWDTNGDDELSYAEVATVTSLGEVFKNNINITSFNELRYFIGLTSIGNNTFYNCSNLTSLVIPNAVTSIGDNAFYNCHNLTSLVIPNAVTSIGNRAFNSCSGLTSLVIPNAVSSIGNYAFGGCSGLTSIEIPNYVTSIGTNPFTGCNGLEQIVVDSENSFYDSRGNCNAIISTSSNALVTGCKNTVIPNTVTSIGQYAFNGCSGLTSLTLPNSVTTIGDYAFQGCSGLTSLTLPNSVTTIGNYAFSGCRGLTSLTIPNSVTTIGNYAFSGCSGLTSLTIGNSVTSIDNWAFSGCTGLTSMTVMADNPPTLGNYSNVFNNVNTSIPVYVPCNSLSTYQFAYGWKSFTNYMPAPGTTCDSGEIIVTASFEEGGTVSGAGYYEGGTTCTLVATANADYTFLYWTENGEVVSTENVYDFIVAGDRTFVANFSCTITVEANPVEGGSVGVDILVFGFDDGQIPVEWSNDITYPWVVTADHDGSFCMKSGNAGVHSSTSVIEVTVDFVVEGTVSFDFWSRGESTTDSYEWDVSLFYIDGSTMFHYGNHTAWESYSANVSAGTHTFKWEYKKDVSVHPIGDALFVDNVCFTGVVGNEEQGDYLQGQTCLITAAPNTGYVFANWTENGEIVSSEPTCSFIVTRHRNLVANFDTNHWTPVNEGAYALSMTIYGVIQINGVEQYSDQLEVGVFCGDECRGSAIAHDFFLTHRYLTEVNVYGENGHQLTFKLYDHALQQELDLTPPDAITFTLDGYGDPINPYVMNFMGDIPLTFHFTTNGNWGNVSNWSEGTLPGPNDRVIINADCGLNVNVIVSSLIVTAGKKLTLQSGKVLTVTGNLTNASAANLVIKDSAQLINASVNVAATLEKNITSYGRDGSNNWYTIASPMNGMPIARSNFLTPSYDLYRYNEANLTSEEWENYKANLADFTTFEKGRGYLFANSNSFSPVFIGTLNNTDVTCSLTCTNRPNDPLSGFNLIGNPFPHNIYKGAGAAIDNANLASGYYTLTNEGTWQAHTFEDAILPGQGILVKATAPTELTIAKSDVAASSESSEAERCMGSLSISIAGDNGQDQAYVYFGQGIGLDKVKSIVTDAPSLAVRNGNGDFAIAHCDKKSDAVELVFTTPTDGSFTMDINVAAGDFNYLHLIDSLTGADVDLLVTPSYTFEASARDDVSRFRLVFSIKGN